MKPQDFTRFAQDKEIKKTKRLKSCSPRGEATGVNPVLISWLNGFKIVFFVLIREIRPICVIRVNKGFTLIEAIVAVGILAGVVIVNLAVLDYANNLSSLSNNISIASNIAQSRLETIRVMSYQDIKNNYTNAGALKTTVFATGSIGGGLTGSVVIIGQETILNSLIRVKVVVSFLDPKGRTIGEDTNLNGILDAGEDINANGELDSNTQMQTVIANSV